MRINGAVVRSIMDEMYVDVCGCLLPRDGAIPPYQKERMETA
jgi:hypothetical protein